ncbi:P-loop containing nucleoside triphosphate hydrolase protein [Aulographum hederae CBS 113979]|uniref:RNA helicase n=1 Tax=Aulographum hederae CBS 113979 TaxID=1176131 RepID=A0A6G1H083_9PEZI|nr:P-loop containing nucleoside triphosphate hydrolase protein [Aulographum hederae CBS 113979]
MLRASAHPCVFCETRSLFPITRTSYVQSRSVSQTQRRIPARHDLSNRVARAPKKPAASGKPTPKNQPSPWDGMNQTVARIREKWGKNPGSTRVKEFQARAQGGQTDNKKKQTRGGFKALKMQKSLANVSYGKRSEIKTEISKVDTFESLPLLPTIQEAITSQALAGMTDIVPTPIQRLAIPALLGVSTKRVKRKKLVDDTPAKKEMEQFLLAAETGSGKTLAYLLPIIDAIKRAEAIQKEQDELKKKEEEAAAESDAFGVLAPPVEIANPNIGRPRAIVLVPSAELVTQVSALAKLLCHKVKFRSGGISAAVSATVIRNRLFSPSGIDIVVSTPHLLASISESDPNILSRVSHLVIDEADSLLDRSFSPLTSQILDKATPSLQQLVLASATIPRSLDSFLHTRFPDIKRLVTPNLHAIPRRVQLGVVDVAKDPFRGNKDLACADTIWTIGRSAVEHVPTSDNASDTFTSAGADAAQTEKERVEKKHILVFVNEREKTLQLAEHLRSKGIDALALSRDTDGSRSADVLAAFTGQPVSKDLADAGPIKEVTKPKKRRGQDTRDVAPPRDVRKPTRMLPNTTVLVATDLGSRGIDTTNVRHVILYDVPHTTIDFIHRLGRTGRMGRRGRGIVLVGNGDRRDVVREVREGMFMGKALI